MTIYPAPAERPERLLTSESVSEGHPDKVADTIADAILDAYLAQDPQARVACEVLCKDGHVVLAGEIGSKARVDHTVLVRNTVRAIGYDRAGDLFHADTLQVTDLLGRQASNIADGISRNGDLGAGDQGLMFGYATDETAELLPLPLVLSHRLTRGLSEARRGGEVPWLRPDAKAQVTVAYRDGHPERVHTVVVSTQHIDGAPVEDVRRWLRDTFIPRTLGAWWHDGIILHLNPAGPFVQGGPEADCGVTGRKIIVDTYGGFARHGGGAFSGKDGSKVDRSGAYMARLVARGIVQRGIARRAEVQICYAIGVPEPLALQVDTFGTGDADTALHFAQGFDFRPAAIIEQLRLHTPLFTRTTNHGHFGKAGLPWEN